MLASHPGIPLEKHLLSVKEKVSIYAEQIKLEENLRKTAELIALTHDIGKATSYFQRHLKGERVSKYLSSHALLSAVISLSHFAKDLSLRYKTILFLAIRSHHSHLVNIMRATNIGDSWDTLEEQVASIQRESFYHLIHQLGLEIDPKQDLLPSLEAFKRGFTYPLFNLEGDISLYFNTNLLLGMLVDADIRSVIDMPAISERRKLPDDLVERYLNTLNKNTPLSFLREEFYKTVLQNIQRYALESKLFSITGPTGIGKTLTGLSAAIKLRNLIFKEKDIMPRIIYVLPFTSIIDQNYDVIKKVLKHSGIEDDILLKHHYRTPISHNIRTLKNEDIWKLLEEDNLFKNKKQEDIIGLYEKANNRVETWDAEIIITTFVRLFETLFTNRRSEARRLHNLATSIVILDEVQNIPVKYWNLTEKSLKFLSKEWNTHFILMTATKPALLQDIPELTTPKKQVFFSKMSRTRLNIDIAPAPYNDVEHWLIPKIRDKGSFLVVMNTIRSAQEVYKALKDRLSYKLYFLSASLIPLHRQEVIEKIKKDLSENKKIGLVSTQVIEAGVDLDFETVIRDMAPLDSIVQAAGRCNRNAKNTNEGEVYLQKLQDPDNKNRTLSLYIYDSILIEATEEFLTEYKTLKEKDYLKLVENYFKDIKENRKSQDREVLASIEQLSYDKIESFSLIEDEMPTIPVFVEYDDKAQKEVNILRNLAEKNLSNYEERMKIRTIIRSIMPQLYAYIVNVPVKTLSELGLPQLPFFSSFLYLPKEHPDFQEIYDKETGFAREIKQGGIFL